jgi:hypothetical protein
MTYIRTSKDTFPTSGKIKVTQEQSVIVQNRLHEEGFTTAYGGATLRNIECPYIFWNSDKHIQWADEKSFFIEDPNPEYTMSLFELAYPAEKGEDDEKLWIEVIQAYSGWLTSENYDNETLEDFISNYLKTRYQIIKR